MPDFGGTIPSFGGHFDKRSPETSRCMGCVCNGWRSDFLHHYVWGVESIGGAFQDSHDGGAEADVLGHTHPHLHFHTIGPQHGSVERFESRDATFLNKLCGETCPGLNAICTCFNVGLSSLQIPP